MRTDIPKLGRLGILAIAVVTTFAAGANAQTGVEHIALANGVKATIYPSDYLLQGVESSGSDAAIRLDDDRLIPVIVDIADPSIVNKGDGTFHPFSTEDVVAVLRALDHPAARMTVRVYLLPYPRRDVLASSTSGLELFLSPHVLAIDPKIAAYIVSHEMGHAFHNRFMPDDSGAWDEYRRIRGITDVVRFNALASHAYRPKEILAEDFRVLFGGSAAYFDGYIENPELASPESVGGLEGFFIRVTSEPMAQRTPHIVATSYPNPFNPETEVRVSLPGDFVGKNERVSVRVYSVTGALVRDLYEGKATGDFAVRWDGTDDRGNHVASAMYYASVVAGDSKETVKLVLLK